MRTVRTVRHATGVLVVLLLAGVLAACGGGGGSDQATSSGARAPERATADRYGSGRGDVGGGSGGGQNQPTGREPLPAVRSVVYSAQLRIRAKNVDQAAGQAKQLTTAAGGYVEKESTTAGSDATVTLKIPSERYGAVLNELSTKLGTKLALSQQAEDVTAEVADVGSRVKSAQSTIASFRKLLDRAGTVAEIIDVEEEIARRQADLEALQARQKALQESTRYATVTVTLVRPSDASPPEDDDKGGFVSGLKGGWGAFTAFLSAAATVVGALLPFLALAAIIALPVHLVLRRARSRKGAGLPPK